MICSRSKKDFSVVEAVTGIGLCEDLEGALYDPSVVNVSDCCNVEVLLGDYDDTIGDDIHTFI